MSQIPTRSDRRASPAMPRWVKVFGLIVIALILLGVLTTVIGGVQHGPNLHTMPMQQSTQLP